MAKIPTSNISCFVAGTEYAGIAAVGTTFDGNYNYKVTCRFKFTTSDDGATSVSFTNTGVGLGVGSNADNIARLYFDITDSATKYKTYQGNDYGKKITTYNYSEHTLGGSMSIKLMPNKTYYLWIFPASNFSSYTRLNIGSCNLTTSGKYGTASTITCSNFTIGNDASTTITLSNSVSGIKNTLEVIYGGTTRETLLNNSSSMSKVWEPNLATYAPLAAGTKYINVTLKCTTKYGTSTWGTSTKTVKLTFPSSGDDSIVPAISSATAAVVNSNASLPNLSLFSVYIQGYSKLSVSVATNSNASTIGNRYGSTIASYSLAVDGKTYNGTNSDADVTSFNLTSDPITSSGNIPYTFTVTDSRGYTASTSGTISVDAYSKPAITSYTLDRRNDNSQPADDGQRLYASAAVSLPSVMKSDLPTGLTNYLRAAFKTTGSWTQETITSGADISTGDLLLTNTLSADSTYAARITITDALGNTTTVTKTIPAASWALKFTIDSGKVNACGIGKAPEDTNVLEIPSTWDFVRGTGVNQERVFGHRKFRTYSSVEDLGFTSGSAKIYGDGNVWDAMPYPSVMYAKGEDLLSSHRPSTYGVVEVIRATDVRGCIYWHGLGSGYENYYMQITSGEPSGAWHRIITDDMLGTVFGTMLAVDTVDSAALSISAGGTEAITASAAKTGYTPIGVVGWSLPGSGSSYAAVFRCYLSGTTLNASIRSVNAAITSQFRWYVLYRKNTY